MGNLAELKKKVPKEEIIEATRQAEIVDFPSYVEYLYEQIDEAIKNAQETKHNFTTAGKSEDEVKILSEDMITILICTFLKGRMIDAEHEASSNGNPDIKVKWRKRTWLAEAKIVSSSANALEGWRQLVDRYQTGEPEDGFGGLLLYLPKKNAALQLELWKQHLKQNYKGVEFAECKFRTLAFLTSHDSEHSGYPICIRHMPVMMYFRPTDASARRSARHSQS